MRHGLEYSVNAKNSQAANLYGLLRRSAATAPPRPPIPEGAARPFAAHRLAPLGLLALGAILLAAFGGGRALSFAALADNRDWLAGLALFGVLTVLLMTRRRRGGEVVRAGVV